MTLNDVTINFGQDQIESVHVVLLDQETGGVVDTSNFTTCE